MKIAMLSPVAWRTPPRHYGPWEQVTSLLCEELVRRKFDVTLFATADSVTGARLSAVCPVGYEENRELDPKIWECLHIANCFEQAAGFDLIHNQFDFLPLSYSRLVATPVVTTIHGFSSPKILEVYKKYNATAHYVAISNADRSPELSYAATIYHGIDLKNFIFCEKPSGDYLLYFGRFHPDKGAREAIEIARRTGSKLVMAGIIQDAQYFQQFVEPALQSENISYIGSIGPAERDRLLGGARALLHPISFDEPFGLSVIEAMACGTPVVAFQRGSMPELIDHGETGFLVSAVDEAVECVLNIKEIDRRCCRAVVEKRFTCARMADDYISLYKKILSL